MLLPGLEVGTSVADATVGDVFALAALFVPCPLQLRHLSAPSLCRCLLELGSRSEQYADRVSPADSILRSGQVGRKVRMGLRCAFIGGEGDMRHPFLVERSDAAVDRTCRRRTVPPR